MPSKIVLAALLLLTATAFSQSVKVIHVFVALCDNVNQGIVPVPEKIGNGQNPDANLYWGCGYGVRTFFKKDADWTMLEQLKNPQANILERCTFKHKTKNIYLVAEAYDGAKIKECIHDFFLASGGTLKRDIAVNGTTISAGGNSSLVAYCGHCGLMEFDLSLVDYSKATVAKDAIVLACYSKNYFSPYLQKTGANPLVWTTHLMAPEAYTLEAAIANWVEGKTTEEIRSAAVEAYSTYQKCSLKAARNLLVFGY
ncbi:MAG: hypothetical protein SH856_04945 [Flavobacteriales bacterium]|nr:hypothetical protein [Flavobacteriales bacterium]